MNVFSTWLTVNRQCNLECKWCYAQQMDESNNMDLSKAKKLIDISVELGIKNFKLIGGEPTIYPHFYTVLEYLMEYDVSIVIVTNGLKLSSKEFCNKLKSYNYPKLHLGISLKGSSDSEYLEDCGKKGFNALIQGLKNCDEYGLSYSLSYVLTKENILNLNSFSDNIIAAGINKNIFFAYCNEVISHDKYNCGQSKDISIEMDYLFSQQYDDLSNKLQDRFKIHQSFPLCLCEKNTFEKMIKKGQVNTSCHVHKRNGLIFDTDGSILLCNHLAGFGIGKFGVDYYDAKSLSDFWDSEDVSDLYNKFTYMPSIKCKDCELSSKCGGGCCIQWFSQYFEQYEKYVSNL